MVGGLAVLAAVSLAAWGFWVRTSAGEPDPPQPATAPTRTPTPSGSDEFSTTLRPIQAGPPPWVRYATPLEGLWVADAGSSSVRLVVRNASFDLWEGVGQRQGQPTSRQVMIVRDDRVTIWRLGEDDDFATFRWSISGGRLSFEPLEATPEQAAKLAGLSFRSAD